MSDVQSIEQPEDGDLNKLKSELDSQIERANRAEGRLKAHILDHALERAGSRAFNAAQIAAMLKPKTEIVQATDKDGKPLDGEYDISVKGENGERLSLRQAVEHLRSTDANLFCTPEELRPSNTGPREGESNMQMMVRLAKTNTAEFLRLLREHPELMGLKRKP